MMTMFQHIAILYAAARSLEMTAKEANSVVEKYAGLLCIPDILQYTVKGDDVAGDGYEYTHFTDGCYMVYPKYDDISKFTDIHQTDFKTGNKENIQLSSINFELFGVKGHNCSGIYEEAVSLHFNNDMQAKRILMNNIFYYNEPFNRLRCRLTDQVYPLEKLDMLLAKTHNFLNRFLVDQIRNETGEQINRDWLIYAESSIKKLFAPSIAQTAIEDIKQTDAVFSGVAEDRKNMISSLKEAGIVRSASDICSLAFSMYTESKMNYRVFLKIAKKIEAETE